jgi:alkylated DNA repair dioxygenase AlkB
MFGPAVAGVSLASRCVMRFRRKVGDGFETWSAELEPRSLYILSGPARSQWQHTIANTPELRYSITFRTLRAKK